MLQHIVMMTLKAVDANLKQERLEKLEALLKDLKNHISSLEKMEVGQNFSTRPTAMDIVLSASFKDEAGLKEYNVHPKHVEVLAFIKEVVEEARVVDYWI